MKTRTMLSAVLLLAASTAFAQNFQAEAQTLWQQHEKARADALKAVDDKYQAALEDCYWRAVAAKDAGATLIKIELDKYGPLKMSGPSTKPKATLPKQMVGKWDASYPGGSKATWDFKEDGTVSIVFGTGKIAAQTCTWNKTKDAVEVTYPDGAVTSFAWPIKDRKLTGNDSNGRGVWLAEARK